MYADIENLVKCEVCAIIRFFYGKVGVHLCAVYGQTIMIESVVHQWNCLFQSG